MIAPIHAQDDAALVNASKIAFILLHCQKGCEPEVLADFTGIPPKALAPGLESLLQENVLTRSNRTYQLQDQSPQLRDGLLAAARQHQDGESGIIRLLCLYHDQRFREFLAAAEKTVKLHLQQKKYLAIRRWYDILCPCFLKMHIDVADKEFCREYIDCSHELLHVFMCFPFILRRSVTWFLKMRGLSFLMHDQSLQARIEINMGSLIGNNFHIASRFSCIESIDKGITIVNSIKHTDIINHSVPYNAMRYFFKGEYIKSINCVYDQFSKDEFERKKYFNRVLYSFSALSAVHLGEYAVAINILEQGHKYALLCGRDVDANTFKGIEAFIYLLMGEDAKALAMINRTLEYCDGPIASYAELWAVRSLAYYHYKNGNILQSYTCYKKYLLDVYKFDIIHTGYLMASFVLELLTAYHLAGYDTDFQRPIQEELNHSFNAPSIILRMIAHRCAAEIRAKEHSWADPAAQDYLNTSLQSALSLSAPIELAKTLFSAARCAFSLNDVSYAKKYLDEALAIHDRYKQPIIPEDFQKYTRIIRDDECDAVALLKKADTRQSSKPLGKDFGFVYHSESMRELQEKVKILATRDTSVLIYGESGVGKEHIARQLHELSGRGGKFIAVNLANVPDELFESEFFGHEKGSFTGAVAQKEGLLEMADGGTLFLDEIADISSRIQVKLLRVLQEKQYMRVGGTRQLKSNFRIVAASNKDLAKEVQNGYFREDLFYRINVFTLYIPPLRDRGHDVIFIAEFFLDMFLKQHSFAPRRFSSDDLKFLTSYKWPGNVRELKNYIERYVFLSESEHKIDRVRLLNQTATIGAAEAPARQEADKPEPAAPSHLAELPLGFRRSQNIFTQLPDAIKSTFLPSIEEIKNQYIEYAYLMANGEVTGENGLANILKVSKVTAYAWVKKMKLKERFQKKLISLD